MSQAAIQNLIEYQEQCDEDGVMVKVSRQAIHEVISSHGALAGALQGLVECYDHFRTTHGDQACAYYALVKGKDAKWAAAHAALSALSASDRS